QPGEGHAASALVVGRSRAPKRVGKERRGEQPVAHHHRLRAQNEEDDLPHVGHDHERLRDEGSEGVLIRPTGPAFGRIRALPRTPADCYPLSLTYRSILPEDL